MGGPDGGNRRRGGDGQGGAEFALADRLLLRAVGAQGRWVVVAVLAAVLSANATLLLPAAVGNALDAALADTGRLPAALGLLVGILIFGVVADVAAQQASTAGSARTTAWLRHRVVRGLITLGLRGRRSYSPGDATARIGTGASAAGRTLPLLLTGVRTVIVSVTALVSLGLIDWILPVTLLAGMAVAVLLLRPFTRQATTTFRDYQEAQSDIASRLVDALAGLRTIRASGTADREVERVLRPLRRLRTAGLRTWLLQRRLAWSFALLVPVLQVAVLAAAGWGLSAGRLSPGDLVAAVGYTGLALVLIERVDSVVEFTQVRAGAARIAALATSPAPPEPHGRLPEGSGVVEFDDVSVRLDGRLVLDQCTVTVPAGSTAAVVGPSGAGKSVLVGLLGRLFEPEEGAIRIDGVDVGDLGRDELREAVAYAFERPILLGDTVGDAVAYGFGASEGRRDDDADGCAAARADERRGEHDERVVSAATAARADGFVRKLPSGYDTPVSQAPLSGGERQRLGLARAVAQRARVLVLDDATSSLDTATEAEVSAALATVLPGRTRIVVAHRAVTAAQADLVVWLDDGRLRAVDAHHLLWRDPDYRQLFGSPADPAPGPGVTVGAS